MFPNKFFHKKHFHGKMWPPSDDGPSYGVLSRKFFFTAVFDKTLSANAVFDKTHDITLRLENAYS